MADAFLTSDLQLDVRAALQQVDRLNEAVHRATTNIRVTADVRQVTASIDAAVDAADSLLLIAADTSRVPGEITAAVDAADTAIIVTGEATDVTGSIDSAVENANTSVEVTGQAAQVTGAIDAAVQNANTTVSVEGQVSPGLRQGVDSLGDGLDAAATSGISLKSILAGLSVTAAVAGIRSLADAGSDLAESTSKASVVFGDEFKDIEAFAGGAAKSVGLTEQAAFEATGTFGNLFQALGTSREEAARLSPEVVSLAADLASFNNLGVDETLEKLRSGLIGEVEPLRSLGVSFLAADVTAKGLELGLGGVTGELTEGEKVQARYALITEQTALAQGDFARTSEGFANQQRILSAELGNAAAAAGTLLLPAVLAIVAAARDAIPGLSELGEDVLPAVSDALVNLAPLIGTSVDLLILMAPILTIVAQALASIPPEAIAVGAGVIVAVKAFKLLSTVGGALAGTGGAAGAIPKIAKAIGALNPLVIAAAVGAGLLFKEWQEGKDRAADVAKVVDGLSESFAGVGTDVTSARGAITGFLTSLIDAGEKIQSTTQFLDETATASEVFGDLGLTAASAANLIAGGTDAVDAFGAELNRLGTPGGGAILLLRQLAEQAGDAAKANLLARLATDGLTDSQERRLTILNTQKAPTEEYVALLDEVARTERAAAAETEFLTAKYAPLIASVTGTSEALERLGTSAPTVESAISALRSGAAEPTARSFLDLASTLDGAKLSEEQMADAAALLGTDVESLQGFVDLATESLQNFTDSAVGALPTVADAFSNVGDDSILSVAEFRKSLDDEAKAMRDFTFNLAVITQAGFADLAGVIAQQGPEIGGKLVSELVKSMAGGNTVLLEQTSASLTNFNDAWTTSTAYLRDTLGPEFVLTAGLIGSAATMTFGDNLTFDERLRIAGEVGALEMDAQGQAIAAIAATEGASAATRYGNALNIDEKTVAEAVKAGLAIQNTSTAPATAGGHRQGNAYGSGFAAGITQSERVVILAAQGLTGQALQAGLRTLRAGSPSKLTRDLLGLPFGQGIAVGIIESGSEVVAAAEQIISDAAAATARIIPVEVDPIGLAASAAGSAAVASGGVLVTIAAGAITVNAPPGMTREQGVEVGEGIADGMERRLVERRLSVLSRAT